jgi:deazaflavin-dependent oxidoreductase (nitroreductase family)
MSITVTPSGTRGVSYPIPRRLMALLTRIPVALQRLSGGRLKMHGQPLLLLTTVGARTGQPRTSMVTQFPESDDSTLIVASSGGAAKHPAWYFNLAKRPDQVFIERNRRRIRVQAILLAGQEREAAWRLIVRIAPGFAEYQRQTDREIPVVRLVALS